MLALGPGVHLHCSHEAENETGPRSGHQREAEPGQDLTGVVGTADQLEEKTTRDRTHTGSWRAQVAEDQMALEIAEFAEDERYQPQVGASGGSRRWIVLEVDKKADKHGGTPVVRAVLVEVEEWHRGVGEAMHKHRLVESLQKVARPTVEREHLHRIVAQRTTSEQGRERREERIEQKRAGVLDQKHGSVADLRTQILQRDLVVLCALSVFSQCALSGQAHTILQHHGCCALIARCHSQTLTFDWKLCKLIGNGAFQIIDS
mmetsp:Transcript_31032/g.77895  ORF Transcript_31032/g.77895 Transcript_31032/m.77895 type:complete len:261 (-) Transcript_31032:110-892(-)